MSQCGGGGGESGVMSGCGWVTAHMHMVMGVLVDIDFGVDKKDKVPV